MPGKLGAAMAQPVQVRPMKQSQPRWPRRYTMVAMFFASTVICYIDRVNVSVAIIPMARDKGYDAVLQGVILSAFFWGYLVSQLLGGWMADRFGGKRVLAFGVAVWSLATILTPPATVSIALLLVMRAILGVGEGVNFPAIHSMAARWMPSRERARAVALNYSGIHLGTVLALFVSPILIVRFGWRPLFYISGSLGALWMIAWFIKAADRPEDSRGVSRAELAAIVADRPPVSSAESVPWRSIAREKAIWAIVLAHTCNNWGLYILLLWLPTYLNRILGVPLERVGNYALVPWLLTFAAGNLGGWAADLMLARGMSVTAVRKLMQTAAFALGAIPLLVLPRVHDPLGAVALFSISSSCSALSLAAFGVNHLDVGPRYAGVLMGISNTFATVPGIIGVAATGFIWQATGSFDAVFYLTSAIYALGAIGYLMWASGEQKL
jgi:ACS family sodium-dependent inorganic phosphate cotransporter